MKRRCPKCSAEWEIKGPIGFREECPECAAYLHICLNCRVYDAKTQGCRSPTTEPVEDPGAMNFCEEFEFGPGGAGAGPAAGAPPSRGASPGKNAPATGKPLAGDDARRRFDSLFRDPNK